MVKLDEEETQFMKEQDRLFDHPSGRYAITPKDTKRYNQLLKKKNMKTLSKKSGEPSINKGAYKAFFGRTPGKITYANMPVKNKPKTGLTAEEEQFRKDMIRELYHPMGSRWISAKDEKRLKQLEAKRKMKTTKIKEKLMPTKKVTIVYANMPDKNKPKTGLTAEEERVRKELIRERYSPMGQGWLSATDEKRLKQLDAKREMKALPKKSAKPSKPKTTPKKKVPAKKKTSVPKRKVTTKPKVMKKKTVVKRKSPVKRKFIAARRGK